MALVEPIWVGNDFVDPSVCQTCYQPECPESRGGARPAGGTFQLRDGAKDYRGYGDWAIHPNEASFLLHRGHAVVDGAEKPVAFIHNETYVAIVHVEGTSTNENRPS